MNKLSQIAAMVKKAGAAGTNDTVLAHITPQEAALLKARGGSGEIDPDTGLPHFDDGGDSSESTTQSAPQYAGFGGYTPPSNDPTYNAGGYYSAAGDYAGGKDDDSNPTRFYNYRQTVGGNIANSMGFDPEGTFSKVLNAGIGSLGMINPMIGLVGKIAQASAGSQSVPSPADMDGNGGSLNMLGRLVGGNNKKLSSTLSGIAAFQQPSTDSLKDSRENFASNDKNDRITTVRDTYEDLKRRRMSTV